MIAYQDNNLYVKENSILPNKYILTSITDGHFSFEYSRLIIIIYFH
jgi:hypothetical protein